MRDALVARGIVVRLVGDVYEVDSERGVLSEEVRRKWCVSVPAESSLAAVVHEIPRGTAKSKHGSMLSRISPLAYGFRRNRASVHRS